MEVIKSKNKRLSMQLRPRNHNMTSFSRDRIENRFKDNIEENSKEEKKDKAKTKKRNKSFFVFNKKNEFEKE